MEFLKVKLDDIHRELLDPGINFVCGFEIKGDGQSLLVLKFDAYRLRGSSGCGIVALSVDSRHFEAGVYRNVC